MKAAVTFKKPVYKIQTTPANVGIVAVAGDTITFVINNATASPTTQDVVATAVLNGGKTIEWDRSTTQNLDPEHVVRVHAKHQYKCPGPLTYAIVLTEDTDSDTVLATITSIKLGTPPATYSVDVTETGSAADGITDQFVEDLVEALQSIIGTNGFVSAVKAGAAGSQTITITITNMVLKPGVFVLDGLTQGTWAIV